MLRPLGSRLVLACRPLVHSPVPVIAALLLVASLALLPVALRTSPPAATVAGLPGTPIGVAVSAPTHQVVLSTYGGNWVLGLDGSAGQGLGPVALGGGSSAAVAVNRRTGHVYIANTLGVAVLADPSAAAPTRIALDQLPVTVAVNPTLNRVYVTTHATGGSTAADELVVLDGHRDAILTRLPMGPGPLQVAVDTVSNHVYVADAGSDRLSVLDGTSLAPLATLPLGHGPHALGVNISTGRVYVGNGADQTVSVLDGAHPHPVGTVAVPGSPVAVGVNERTNRIYVAHRSGMVSVLHGATHRLLASLRLGQEAAGLAVDAESNRVYVTDPQDGAVWLLEDRRFGRLTSRLFASAARAEHVP